MRKREIWGFWAKEGQSSKPFMQNKANCPQAQMNASSVSTKDYENKSACGGQENKPKQSQFSRVHLGVLLLISATQSLSGSCGGWPMATEPGPVTSPTLSICSGPPVRGLYQRTLNVPELSPRFRFVVPPSGRYMA